MLPRTLTESAAAPTALAAFLRGIERRGAVFAQLQCGDAVRGDAALAAAMRAFREGAPGTPIGDWPQRFWGLLLATPALRRQAGDAGWPAGLQALSQLGNGPRAALLLRLVAGMQETAAAAVLGIAPPSYQLALRRALPRLADGSIDEPGWHALAEATQLAIRQLPPARLAHLAQLRELALLERPPPRPPRTPTTTTATRPRWLLRSLWTGVAACVLGLAASFLLPAPWRHDGGEPRIRRTPLPPAEAPASRFDAQLALFTDRDFEMLRDADGADVDGHDVDFRSWYAAQLAAANGNAAIPLAAADTASVEAGMPQGASGEAMSSESSPLESSDAPR